MKDAYRMKYDQIALEEMLPSPPAVPLCEVMQIICKL